MQTTLECIPCFIRQSLEAAKAAGCSDDECKKILVETSNAIEGIDFNNSPPKTGKIIHDIVKKVSGSKDPYRKLKLEMNKQSLSVLEVLKKTVSLSSNPLLASAQISIAGNMIDFGAPAEFDIYRDLNKAIYSMLRVNHYEQFVSMIEKADNLLFLADNAGETVFDRVFIENIKKNFDVKITYVVKEGAIINDALKEDAVYADIDRYAKIMSNGSNAPGTVFEYCSDEFNSVFKKADVIISKGQGNYESLNNIKSPVFFMFKVKCNVLAKQIGYPVGSNVFMKSRALEVRER
jgi:uncharacterized protein with ATP-grasp and redox domains